MSDAPQPPRRRHGLLLSFRFSFEGLAYFFRTQRNAWIHLLFAAAACAVAAWLDLSRVEWSILVLTIAGVIILEGINTAIEVAVDLASPDIHPLAKIAKDVAAAMVLLGAIAAAIIGLLILGPPLWQRLMTSPASP